MIQIFKRGTVSDAEIFGRDTSHADVSAAVSEIIETVRQNGDAALRMYSEKFDRATLTAIEVTDAEIEEAFEKTDPKLLSIMQKAAENITAFHEHQKRASFVISEKPGIVLGQKVIPLSKVGLYVPGGTASYPSSVLMNCLPAKIAGVGEIVMVSPPTYEGGKINPVILAAAKIAGVGRIFKVGGAQAVAALAYGTETIPAVDKIVGPGNAFVAEAKKQVFGKVGIDMIAGPSEILVIADGTSDPRVVAADLLSQAEHDKLASAVLVTDSESLANDVQAELEVQIDALPRREIARVSIDQNGKIILCASIDEAIAIANRIAPEHLELSVDNPFDYLDAITNAGSIFLGKNCPEALGDYFAGPNHTLPTSGTARFSSPLSVDDFVKKSAFSYYTADALAEVADDIAYFAEAEGLSAHGRSAISRKPQTSEANR